MKIGTTSSSTIMTGRNVFSIVLVSILSIISVVQGEKDGSYYIAGTGNPNVDYPMYWKDTENILADLNEFSALYVQFHQCAWTWMQYDDDGNDVDEDDYWYMSKIPPMGANVAFSLYGVLKGKNFQGCSASTFINSFYTNQGFTDFTDALSKMGVSGMSSYTSSSYSATCQGGSGIGCDYSNGFALHTYSTDECDPQYYSSTSDSMSNLNSALASVECTQIYDSSSSYNYGLDLLTYSHSCFYQDVFSPDGECPDPYGLLAEYQTNFYNGIQESKQRDPYQVSKRRAAYKKQTKQGQTHAALGLALCFVAGYLFYVDLTSPKPEHYPTGKEQPSQEFPGDYRVRQGDHDDDCDETQVSYGTDYEYNNAAAMYSPPPRNYTIPPPALKKEGQSSTSVVSKDSYVRFSDDYITTGGDSAKVSTDESISKVSNTTTISEYTAPSHYPSPSEQLEEKAVIQAPMEKKEDTTTVIPLAVPTTTTTTTTAVVEDSTTINTEEAVATTTTTTTPTTTTTDNSSKAIVESASSLEIPDVPSLKSNDDLSFASLDEQTQVSRFLAYATPFIARGDKLWVEDITAIRKEAARLGVQPKFVEHFLSDYIGNDPALLEAATKEIEGLENIGKDDKEPPSIPEVTVRSMHDDDQSVLSAASIISETTRTEQQKMLKFIAFATPYVVEGNKLSESDVAAIREEAERIQLGTEFVDQYLHEYSSGLKDEAKDSTKEDDEDVKKEENSPEEEAPKSTEVSQEAKEEQEAPDDTTTPEEHLENPTEEATQSPTAIEGDASSEPTSEDTKPVENTSEETGPVGDDSPKEEMPADLGTVKVEEEEQVETAPEGTGAEEVDFTEEVAQETNQESSEWEQIPANLQREEETVGSSDEESPQDNSTARAKSCDVTTVSSMDGTEIVPAYQSSDL